MKRTIFAALIAFSLAAFGCENKPAETPEADGAVANKEETKETPEETKTEEKASPTSAPTSQASEGHDHGKLEMAADLNAGETKLFGSRFTIIEPAVTLADAIKKSDEFKGPYKIEGTMKKVCKKKGCWFTVTGEGVEDPVRVRMKDYGFLVPRNAETARAVIEGVLSVREIPVKEAQHYAEDEGKSKEEVAKITEPKKTYEITATSVELTLPKS